MPRDQMSDDREGQESEGWVLPYEPVHRCLEWVARAARGCLPRVWHRGQVLGDPVRQRAPESRTGSAWLGPLYSKVICFDVFDEFRGVKNR